MKKDSDLKWSDLKKSLQKSDNKELINIIRTFTGILRTTEGICLPGSLIGKRLPKFWKSIGK